MSKHGYEFTAFILDKKGRVISIGKNSYTKTHPIQAKAASSVGLPKKIFLHAEVAALVKLKDINKAHSVRVIRHYRSIGNIEVSPCPICSQMLDSYDIVHL